MNFWARMILSIFGRPWSVSESIHSDFIFILGAGRSGNTLLRRLLMERASIYIPPETYVLPMVARLRWLARGLPWSVVVNLIASAFQYHPEFKWMGACDLSSAAREAKSWPKGKRKVDIFLLKIYREMAEYAGSNALFLGDKTPLNTLHPYGISSIIPGAKYVYIFRDGVDVVESYVNAGLYQSHEKAAKRWVDSVNKWNKLKKTKCRTSCYEVRYEDLVSDPEFVVESLIDVLCLPKRSSPIEISSTILGDVSGLDHHSNVTRKPSTDSIGRGRKAVPVTKRKSLARIMNKALVENGYEAL